MEKAYNNKVGTLNNHSAIFLSTTIRIRVGIRVGVQRSLDFL